MRERLLELLDGICPADRAAMEDARTRWNSLAKPIGSLGFLEEAVVRAAGITGDARHVSLNRPALVVMCADHGVVREGVSQTGQEVTRIVAENFTRNQTSTSILCRRSGTDIFPVDIGMLGPSFPNGRPQPFVMLNRKVAEGSKNIVREAAMSMEECLKALLAGLFLVRDLKERGYGILAVGEMGIGNTTPSSAVGSVLTGLSPKEVTGKGAGLSEAAFEKKKAAVAAAVGRFYEAHPEYASYAWLAEPAEKPECAKRIFHVCALLAELGGFDLAGMAGVFLGGAVYRLPVVMDGFISSTAALCAVCMNPLVRDFLFPSHVSSETASRAVLDALDMTAPLQLDMHLGEGSGAVALLPLLLMGVDVYEQMSTFQEIEVEPYLDYEAAGGMV